MPPVPPHAMVFTIGGVEFVLRPGGAVLFCLIGVALDLSFLPAVLPGPSLGLTHLAAVAVTLLMIATTLLHEAGHAAAYRVQGIWPVRITLRGGGGACAALVGDDDTPGRALVRALAGPAVTVVLVVLFYLGWHVPGWPAWAHVIAFTMNAFSVGEVLFNTLPIHPRSDGTHALRAALWLVRGREPQPFDVLYLWRPLVLAAAVVAALLLAQAGGLAVAGSTAAQGAVALVLGLCAVPPLALVVRGRRQRPGRSRMTALTTS